MKVKFTTNIDSEILKALKIKAIEENVNVNYLLEEIIKERGFENMKYKVFKTNMFDDKILNDLVAVFCDLKSARDFVEYKSAFGESYCIIKDGKRINID
jgi:hypothetical protein